MRSDTLDWSQYPIIYNSIYTDTNSWTPEEISFFQDAIYKGEKDFHQVASDVSLTSLFPLNIILRIKNTLKCSRNTTLSKSVFMRPSPENE